MLHDDLTNSALEFFLNVVSPVPRRTFNEDRICKTLYDYAAGLGLTVKYGGGKGGKKNVIVYKDASGKYKDSGTNFPVIFQAHVDMVCAASVSGPDADFSKIFANGVELYDPDNGNAKVETLEDFRKAKRVKGRSANPDYPGVLTTLGADDGIGVAAIFAILMNRDIAHPPLIAVFTVEEEDGMDGAADITFEDIAGIAPAGTPLDFSKAKFINVDDERDGVYSVSCAGSLRADVSLAISRSETMPANAGYYTLSVSGLAGGHSGINIHEGRANAIVLLCGILHRLTFAGAAPALISFSKSGTAANVIPSNASALIAVPKDSEALMLAELKIISDALKASYIKTDPNLKVSADKIKDAPSQTPYASGTLSMLSFLCRSLPNGALMWDAGDRSRPPLVQASCNIGLIEEKGGGIVITCMVRSSADDTHGDIAGVIKALCGVCNTGGEPRVTLKEGASSPGWAFKEHNRLSGLFLEKYKDITGKQAEAAAIHAGLECGRFAKIFSAAGAGDIDMIACGPLLTNVHSIEETLHVDTVPTLMKLLAAVLESVV